VIYIGDGWHHGWGYSDHRWVRDNSPRPIGGSVRIWSHDVARPRPLLPRALLTGHAPDRAGHTRLSLPAAVAHPPAVATRAQTLWAQEHQASDRGRQSLAPHVPSGRAPAPAPHVTSVHTPTPAPHVPSGRAPVPAPHVTSVHAPTQAFTPTPRRPNTLTTATPPTPTRTPTPRPAHAVTPAHTATPVRTFSSPGPSPSSVAHSSFAPSSGGSAHSDSARGSASLGSPSSSSGRGSGGPSAGPSPATDRTKKPSKR
jgi:hypothetical protein